MDYQLIQTEVNDRIGTIFLNRPEKRNALNALMVTELKHAFTSMGANDAVKIIILKAKGDSFCAGADLAYLQQLQKNSFEENLADSNQLKELFLLIYTLKKIVVSQIEGHAIAGGCGLAIVCDFCFAVPEANFGFTEVKIGFIPAIVMVFLMRKLTESKCKELLLTGNIINAQTANSWGLVNFIVEKDKINNDVKEFVNGIIKSASGQAIGTTKQMMAAIQHLSVEEALTNAANQNAMARATADCQQGINAFLNKIKPSW
jgi:methylglutaconyl-CoA hydratase